MRSLGCILIQYDWCPTEGGEIRAQTHTGRDPGEDDGRHGRDVSASQEIPKIASKPQKLGERPGAHFLTAVRSTQSCPARSADCPPPELRRYISAV